MYLIFQGTKESFYVSCFLGGSQTENAGKTIEHSQTLADKLVQLKGESYESFSFFRGYGRFMPTTVCSIVADCTNSV